MGYSKTVESIKTEFERERMLAAIEALKQALYKTDERVWEEEYKANVPILLAPVMREEMPVGRQSREQFLEELKAALEKLPEVTVTLAFDPTEAFVEQVAAKVEELVGGKVLVKVRVRRLMLGGARVEASGRIKDYSIRHRLGKILEAQGEKIAQWGNR